MPQTANVRGMEDDKFAKNKAFRQNMKENDFIKHYALELIL